MKRQLKRNLKSTMGTPDWGSKVCTYGSERIPWPLCQAASIHEAFRQLGFKAEEIFVGLLPAEVHGIAYDNVVTVILRSQDKQFAASVCRWDISQEEFAEKWAWMIDWINNRASPEELDRMWQQSAAGSEDGFVTMGQVLQEKGFFIPKLVS